MAGGANLFSYPANPVSGADPLGLLWPLAVGGLAVVGVYSMAKGIFSGGKDGVDGGELISGGRAKQAAVEECISRQIMSGFEACPRSGEELQSKHDEGAQEIQDGIRKVTKGAAVLATSVPGTSITGAVPTSTADLAAGGVVTIITNTGGGK